MERTNADRVSRRPWSGRVVALFGLLALGVAGWIIFGHRLDPETLLHQATADLAAKRFDKVESTLRTLAKLRPPTVEDRLLQAELARATGRDREAIEALSQVPDTHPRAALVWLTRGLLELHLDQAQHAETAFRQALKLDPTLADARRELIRITSFQNRREALAAEFIELAKSGDASLSFDDLYLWTLRRSRTVGLAEIAEVLKRWVATDPTDIHSRVGLASALRRLGRLDQAEAVLQEIPEKTRRESPEIMAVQARIALDRGEVDTARHLLETSTADDSEITLLLGQVALSESKPQAALDFFRSSAKSRPKDREVLFGLAQSLRLTGEKSKAKAYQDIVTAQDNLDRLVQQAQIPSQQSSPSALAEIAQTCLVIGDREAARAWYRLSLKQDPTNSALQSALHRLDSR